MIVKFIPEIKILLRCINLMRIIVPLINASIVLFVFKFLTMQLTFKSNLCGGKPLIVKEFFISLQRFLFFRNNLNKLSWSGFHCGGIKHR
jgi:hypothetical protein